MNGDKNFFEDWFEYQKKLFEPFANFYQPSDVFTSFFPKFEYIDPLAKLRETGDTYKNLFDFFKSFTDTFFLSKESYDFEKFVSSFKDYQDKYVDLIKNIFGLQYLSSPEKIFDTFARCYGLSAFEDTLFKPLKDYLLSMDVSKSNFFDLIVNNEDIEKFLKTPPLGLTREFVEIIKKVMRNYIEYVKYLRLLEEDINKKAKESFNKFLEEIFELIKKGEKLEEFDKVFQKWIEVNENIFQEYFRSEEFCKTLGEYIKVSANLKKSIDEYTYIILKDTNIATKTELDRAYKDIYNLKKELKEIKRLINKEDK